LRTLNLGILAHVDAGQTSLTERLLFEAGAIPELASPCARTWRLSPRAMFRSIST
jgi:ribosomal protection tetracycline resistance protein